MLHPAPTTKIDPTLTRATLLEVRDATANAPSSVVLGFPNSSYKTMLETSDDLDVLRPLVGEMIIGRIFARACRVDRPHAGGRRIDPCFGTPRRVMGTVIAIDPAANAFVMDAGAPVLLTLTAPGQQASQFADAEFVACDILPGARFALQRS